MGEKEDKEKEDEEEESEETDKGQDNKGKESEKKEKEDEEEEEGVDLVEVISDGFASALEKLGLGKKEEKKEEKGEKKTELKPEEDRRTLSEMSADTLNRLLDDRDKARAHDAEHEIARRSRESGEKPKKGLGPLARIWLGRK